MIVRLGDEFFECRWTEDDALVISDMHNRERLRVSWPTQHAPPTRAGKLLMVLSLSSSRAVRGGPPDETLLDARPSTVDTEPARR